MKGARLLVLILNNIALSLALLMVVLNLYPSWSQYARSLEEPLLLATLSSISSAFLIRSFTFKDKYVILFKFLGINIRVEHLNRITGFLFIAILCTPVTHPNAIIETLHLIFTGLAILTAILEIIFYNKNKLAYLGAFFAVVGFVLAYFFNLYTIGLGELIVALIIAFNIWWHRLKIKMD